MSVAGASQTGMNEETDVGGGELAIVIMAAGKGTRLKSRRPKVLHEIGGKPLLSHVIAAAERIVPAGQIFAVVGHQAERVRAAVEATGVQFVEQTEQRGTGHAIQCAADAIKDYENILVLSGDVPLIRTETIEKLWKFHQIQRAAMTILTAAPEDPTGYGRVLRASPESAEVTAIVEQKDLQAEQHGDLGGLREINSGIYVFRTAPLLEHLHRLTANNSAGEFYLTDMAALLRAAGERVMAIEATDAAEILGANTIAELVALDETLRAATAKRLMAEGVTIFRPETCVIDADVQVAPDTVIEPFVQLLGKTVIGSECRIRSYSVLENCVLGDAVLVRQSCVMVESKVANGAQIGPFSRLREGTELGENVHVGNFVETKNAVLGKGTKANHLAYIGDAEVGGGTNIGAGVITANYDGVRKSKTKIGSKVFVGSDSVLVAPISVGDGALIAAGSTITQDVPADALAVGRARQVTKEGWAASKRMRQEQSKG
ncbi:bifunctional UDP-N-acetylglucosamine diphosphorylase/glucosamine-1-phosphate N-acetyltransferase GlmU [Terracidiphilus sp.]|uniref:bifunctional UDP-N-acetylglucosamine diphosphorylase/glucosamine-1-phosphate N-acetyltransferase GlmU n=1 Tax=Terracidiphilus sp. TaxID=1964191 RepID=UPI003C248043